MAFEVKMVEHKKIVDELIQLYNLVFEKSCTRAFWEWLFLKSPISALEPNIIIAVEGGKIIGARPLVLRELWIKDKKVKAAQPAGTMVHPDHRRKGVFSKMNELAIEYFKEKGFALFFNFPRPASRAGYLKQGWKLVSTKWGFLKVLNATPILTRFFHTRLLGVPAGVFYNFISNLSVKRQKIGIPYSLKVYDQINEDFAAVDALKNKELIHWVRSTDYLKWRFESHPELKYKYILAWKDNELYGYMVITTLIVPPFNVKGGVIVDYLVKDGQKDCFVQLINQSIAEFKKMSCAVIFTWECHEKKFNEELKAMGFKFCNSFPYNKFLKERGFVVRELSEEITKEVDIYQEQNWHLTLAFTDII